MTRCFISGPAKQHAQTVAASTLMRASSSPVSGEKHDTRLPLTRAIHRLPSTSTPSRREGQSSGTRDVRLRYQLPLVVVERVDANAGSAVHVSPCQTSRGTHVARPARASAHDGRVRDRTVRRSPSCRATAGLRIELSIVETQRWDRARAIRCDARVLQSRRIRLLPEVTSSGGPGMAIVTGAGNDTHSWRSGRHSKR